MKKLIYRKIYNDIGSFFLSSLLIVGLIVWTIQAVNYFDFVTEDGHGLKVYYYYSILNFPKIIQRILPFILLTSFFLVLKNYENKSEIHILWINGVTKINFLNKMLLFSCILLVFQLILGTFISPNLKLEARNYLKNSNIDFFTSLIKEGKFINVTEGLTIFIDKKEKDGTFKNIFLEENKKNNSKMIYAQRGVLLDDISQKTFQLFDGRVIDIKKSKINLFDFDKINFNLLELNTRTITDPKIQEIDTKKLLSCFFNIKITRFKDFKCSENLIKEIKIEIVSRVYKPIYILIIVLFSSFLILLSKNKKDYNLKVIFLFLINFLILIYSEVSLRYIGSSNENTIIYIFTPIIIFIFGYFFFYRLSNNV